MTKLIFLPKKDLRSTDNRMKQNWQIADEADEQSLKLYESFGINKTIGAILFARGLRDKEAVSSYLFPELNNLHSPFLMKGVSEAVSRIRKAFSNEEKISIFADSDLDGITSLTILYDLFTKCGSTPFIRYPRDKEGYGLTCDIIDEFINAGTNLLITVDSGIRDIEEIAYAKKNGIEVIITDHHEPDSIFPDAIIVNPKMPDCSYPFRELAGVGVAFKLAQAVLFSYTKSYNQRFVLLNYYNSKFVFQFILNGINSEATEITSDSLNEFLNSTIKDNDYIILADNIPEQIYTIFKKINPGIKVNTLLSISKTITGTNFENHNLMMKELLNIYKINSSLHSIEDLTSRIFLELQMRSSKKRIERLQIYIALAAVGTIADIMPLFGENRNIIKYGLEVIKNGNGHGGIQALIGNSEATAKTIGWDVAPLLNAPGRLGETALTVDFFLNDDSEKIYEIIKEIEKLNRERRKMVTSVTDRIKLEISADPDINNRNLYFYMGKDIKSGLAGLIASRIADELKKPVIIAVEEPDSEMVKGSGRSYNEFNFFKYVEPFSNLFEKIGGHAQAFGFTAKKNLMYKIIDVINDSINDEFQKEPNLKIDTLIDINEINLSLIDKITLFEPFGKCNEEPVFVIKNIILENFSKFGNSENHGRYLLKNEIYAIGWNMAEKMELYMSKNAPVDIVCNLEKNTFMNRTTPRLKIIDIDLS